MDVNNDIEIALCNTRGILGNDVGICNLADPKDTNRFVRKYDEARDLHRKYTLAMAELQRMFEEEIGKVTMMIGEDGVPSLNSLLSRYGLTLEAPDPADAA